MLTADQLLAEASALPPRERRELAEALLLSADDDLPHVEDDDAELLTIAEERSKALAAGTAVAITAEESLRRLRERIARPA